VRVILVRHAEAAPGDPDAERPLTAAGRATAQALATRLASERPSVVLSSPLLRALETATPIAEAAGVTLQIDGRLAPGAGVDDVRAVTAAQGQPVVVVGHQPDCGEIVLALTGQHVRFPPGGTCDVEL
jgi:phosphohistidine phosphatase SixA